MEDGKIERETKIIREGEKDVITMRAGKKKKR